MKLIGFQICNARGVNIQGDDDDPTGYPSYAVFSPKSMVTEAAKHPGMLWMPIFEGDVQEPQIV